eukprot:GHVP01040212.1.p1 GENE.GHVP01040212.1~~GHVP01040212.1.p1  ORF type:complete len:212 (+),score=27.25 GHVP01040212.1:53-637(+)
MTKSTKFATIFATGVVTSLNHQFNGAGQISCEPALQATEVSFACMARAFNTEKKPPTLAQDTIMFDLSEKEISQIAKGKLSVMSFGQPQVCQTKFLMVEVKSFKVLSNEDPRKEFTIKKVVLHHEKRTGEARVWLATENNVFDMGSKIDPEIVYKILSRAKSSWNKEVKGIVTKGKKEGELVYLGKTYTVRYFL